MDWTGQTILAPLTKGGNLPFRRLCVDFGARVTVSEMAYARNVVRRSPSEMALLKRHESEPSFGVQLAVGRGSDGVTAGATAVERGADFVDVNAGCPIHDVVRRGMGATLLRRPNAFARLVEEMVDALDVPVTVKIRSGWTEAKINALEVGAMLEDAGAAALTLHARTREQRYRKNADWELIAKLVDERSIPVVGNGDVYTWYEAERLRERTGCAAVMIARGALIKPWLFREIDERTTWLPTAAERVEVYHRFVGYAKEHFGDDERGRTRAMRFLPWHFGFFRRWRAIPDEVGQPMSLDHPLLQTRQPNAPDDPLEQLLADAREDVHARLAETLWGAPDAATAVTALEQLARDVPPPDPSADADEVAVAHG